MHSNSSLKKVVITTHKCFFVLNIFSQLVFFYRNSSFSLGSCYIGYVQYFTDATCTDYFGFGSFYMNNCAYSYNYNFESAYQMIQCSLSEVPGFPTSKYVAQE